MKKTLIASAVAAAALSTNTFAMDQATDLAERLDSMPTFYGNIQLVNNTVDDDDDTNEASTFDDNGSTIGIKHSHAVSDDITAFMKAEFEFSADDKASSNGIDSLDEAYIGVKGGFGSIQIGSDDTVYEWIDHLDIEEAVGVSSDVAGVEEGNNIQYVSPTIGGGLEVGVTLNLDTADTDEFNGAVAAKYTAMENLDLGIAYAIAAGDNEDAIGLAATYGLGDLALTAQYETQDEDADFIGLMANYSMGANNFNLTYAMTDFENDDELSEIYLQALHNVSDNAYVFVEYVISSKEFDAGGDDEDVDTLSVGAAYSF